MNLALEGISLPLRFRPVIPMSEEALLRFCAANDALRVEREVNGEILIMTPAGSRTSRMNMRIARLLDEWAEADGRGVTFDSNGGFTLPDGSMRAPDAAWVLVERWSALNEQEKNSFAPLCPDFVIELRSQSDRLSDIQAKMKQWIDNGAQLGWLIDPLEKTVTIYRSNNPPEVHTDPISVAGTGCIRGFELVLSRIWI